MEKMQYYMYDGDNHYLRRFIKEIERGQRESSKITDNAGTEKSSFVLICGLYNLDSIKPELY